MNLQQILNKLKTDYPKANVVFNNQENPTEIICEIEPTSRHSNYSTAIAIIDRLKPHYHKVTTEVYEVIKGELAVIKNGKSYALKAHDKLTIKPGEIHYAEGNKAWVRVTSRPGWTHQDHHLILDEFYIGVFKNSSILDKLKKLMIRSGEKHNLPNAAIIVSESGKIVGVSESLVATNTDATAHAERLVISRVCKKEKAPTIPNYSLITVLEPCLMCISAAYWAGIKNIYFIIPSSRYYDKLPWITESKKISKKKLIAQFEENMEYHHLEEFDPEFAEIFDQFVNKVIKKVS